VTERMEQVYLDSEMGAEFDPQPFRIYERAAEASVFKGLAAPFARTWTTRIAKFGLAAQLLPGWLGVLLDP
jgi:hypothetical protein